MQSDTIPLEDSLAVSYKTNYNLTIQSSNHTPQYYLKTAKILSVQSLHMDIYSTFIHNCQNL